MPEIQPDLADQSRCISVHWSLPVQCVLPPTHRENWHEAWHPQSGNRIRYRRSMGVYGTEELRDGDWHDLEIPPPGDAEAQRIDRDAIQKRVDAATDERWIHMCLGSEGCVVIPDAKTARERGRRVAMFGYREWLEDHHNADFVAHALADVRTLLADNERLEKVVQLLGSHLQGGAQDVKDVLFHFAEVEVERDNAKGLAAIRGETIQRVQGLHSEFRIYGECGHADENDCIGDPIEVDEVGWTCEAGYQYSICRECCTVNDAQSVTCVEEHTHEFCWKCDTREALDGEAATS